MDKLPFVKNKTLLLTLILTAVALAAIGVAAYYYWQTKTLVADPGLAAEREAKKIVAEVSQLMALPVDEEPTIATVSDPDRLKGQEFFAHAVAGDKVLIYSRAKKVILYSPTSHKIIEVAPIADTGAKP